MTRTPLQMFGELAHEFGMVKTLTTETPRKRTRKSADIEDVDKHIRKMKRVVDACMKMCNVSIDVLVDILETTQNAKNPIQSAIVGTTEPNITLPNPTPTVAPPNPTPTVAPLNPTPTVAPPNPTPTMPDTSMLKISTTFPKHVNISSGMTFQENGKTHYVLGWNSACWVFPVMTTEDCNIGRPLTNGDVQKWTPLAVMDRLKVSTSAFRQANIERCAKSAGVTDLKDRMYRGTAHEIYNIDFRKGVPIIYLQDKVTKKTRNISSNDFKQLPFHVAS